jgi:hypothetical protein
MKAKTTTTSQWERKPEVLFENYLKSVEHFCLRPIPTEKGNYFREINSNDFYQMSDKAEELFAKGDYSHLILQEVRRIGAEEWLHVLIAVDKLYNVK